MYPSIRIVQGFAPAAAQVSALGKLGPAWTIVVLVLAWLSLGLIAGLTSQDQGTIRIGLSISSCTYAYYLTQVLFVGALLYSNGLVCYFLPIAVTSFWSSIFGLPRTEDQFQIELVR